MPNPRSRHKPAHDAPEITTSPATAGRETLVAIAEDEADQARALLDRRVRASTPAPPSSSAASPPTARPAPPAPSARAGRAAPSTPPARAAAPSRSTPPPRTVRGVGSPQPSSPPGRPYSSPPTIPPGGRTRMETVDYHDRPLPPVSRESSAPEIEVGTRPMGRDTLAAITGDLAHELLRAISLEERSAWLLQLEEAIVLEPFRFEVRGAPMLARPNDALRREFVAARLLHRLPVRSMDDVLRVDAAPTADDALTLTLWVRIPEPLGPLDLDPVLADQPTQGVATR